MAQHAVRVQGRKQICGQQDRFPVPARGSQPAVPISIEQLLVWAFQAERVTLNLDRVSRLAGFALPGFGFEYVLLQQAKLGCRVDGGGRSDPHPDAEIVAAALVELPEEHGGMRTGIWIAELARAGIRPDCMQDARPRFEPADVHTNRHGTNAKTRDAADLGPFGWPAQPRRNRKGVIVQDAVQYTPVVCRPTPDQIGRARRAYLQWRGTLFWLRISFQTYGGLTGFKLTDEMPPLTPWAQGA